jgi:hypothetical protein
LDRLALSDPAREAGPSAGGACAFVAALLGTVSAEITRLAADAGSDTCDTVRGELLTAAVLGEAVIRAGTPLIELDLAGAIGEGARARPRSRPEELGIIRHFAR